MVKTVGGGEARGVKQKELKNVEGGTPRVLGCGYLVLVGEDLSRGESHAHEIELGMRVFTIERYG